MEKIREVLMRRDGNSEEEAERRIKEAKEILNGYLEEGDIEAAEEICSECFGLEPDYLMELI